MARMSKPMTGDKHSARKLMREALSDGSGSSFAGVLSSIVRKLRNRLELGLVSQSVHIGLRRPTGMQKPLPAAAIPLFVRPMQPQDLPALLPVETRQLPRSERNEIELRRCLAAEAPEGCFVAVDAESGEPCFMAWLIGAGSALVNLLDGMPPLQPHQAVVEYAYIPPSHRGRGIMAPAGLMVAEQAQEFGASETVVFIGEANIPSLKGARRAGFSPYMRHIRTHFPFGLFYIDRFLPLRAGQSGWPPQV